MYLRKDYVGNRPVFTLRWQSPGHRTFDTFCRCRTANRGCVTWAHLLSQTFLLTHLQQWNCNRRLTMQHSVVQINRACRCRK